MLAAPGRDKAHELCFGSIESSDIGPDYTVCCNPPGVARREHWRATHELAAQANSDLVLVLEDDCLVNKHILYNCRTWKWPRDRLYAAGWLYSPGGLFGGRDVWYTKDTEWYGTVGVLYKRSELPRLIDRAMRYMQDQGTNAWDLAMARAILCGGRRLRVHGPPLVEHLYKCPSALSHKHNYWFGSTRGQFRARWKRPNGCQNRLRR